MEAFRPCCPSLWTLQALCSLDLSKTSARNCICIFVQRIKSQNYQNPQHRLLIRTLQILISKSLEFQYPFLLKNNRSTEDPKFVYLSQRISKTIRKGKAASIREGPSHKQDLTTYISGIIAWIRLFRKYKRYQKPLYLYRKYVT